MSLSLSSMCKGDNCQNCQILLSGCLLPKGVGQLDLVLILHDPALNLACVCWAIHQCAAQLSTVVHSSVSWWGCCQSLSCLIWEVERVTVYITLNLKYNCRHNLCYFSVFCSYLIPPGFTAFRFFQPLLHFFNIYKCLERDITLDPFYITHGHLTFFHINEFILGESQFRNPQVSEELLGSLVGGPFCCHFGSGTTILLAYQNNGHH